MAKELLRMCSQCGQSGHSSRACPDRGSVKLFGVRLTATNDGLACMRKSLSLGNLGQYRSLYNINHSSGTSECGSADQDGYLSDGLVHSSSNARERKKGVPWSEEEHRMFLYGLEKLGKGDWRGISRNFVTTRTPTQVASHAQKYFLRQSNLNKRKRRSSLFDMCPHDTHVTSSLRREDSLGNLYEFSPNHSALGVSANLELYSFGVSPTLSLGRSPQPVDPVLEEKAAHDGAVNSEEDTSSMSSTTDPPAKEKIPWLSSAPQNFQLSLWPELELMTSSSTSSGNGNGMKPMVAGMHVHCGENTDLSLSIALPSRNISLNSKGSLSSAIRVV
uniref:MYB family transcription factor MYB4 n=1 Tax=Larix gmelinii var. olgensis TaxID=188928 RepID=A0A5J6SUU0_9CONI|nr:MYB family transcription factor MYB4 [Larix gmelinii var. olgensis]